MATTPETAQQDQTDFADAFHGADPVRTEQTEDEAFGLTEEPEPQDAEVIDEPTESPDAAAAESGAEGQAGADGAAPSVTIAIDPVDEGPTDPKDIQREKSWEGRLRAKEAELKAREEALSKPAEAMEPGETAGQEAAEPAVTEAVEQAAEKVESGELTVEQALQSLSGDFGEDFTKMLGVLIKAQAQEIAGQTADERIGPVKAHMDGIVSEIVGDKERKHYESIADAHPDFVDVAGSPEFKEYIDAMDETSKAAAMQVIEAGSARQIVKLLGDFKAGSQTEEKQDAPGEDPEQQQAMDAAEGVRSSGLKLPTKPSESQDYNNAWDEF